MLEIRCCLVGPWHLNAYALVCPVTSASALVDPGAQPERLLELLDGTLPVAILVTHSHRDHVGALAEMREILRVPVAAHEGPPHHGSRIEPDIVLAGGSAVEVGESHVVVHATPGHTRDQLCFDAGGNRFLTGDTVFSGSLPPAWAPEALDTLLTTMREVVLPWPDDLVCYPGHGPTFRFGDVRAAISSAVNAAAAH